ncbi:SMC family ATPase [Deinococcus sp.]|uniref:AAA family ATPase n=1 Tax=Deinococcus sp. TaxID=47478 RepID=UPI0025EBE52D|nr:SMC family ATPase [Deinococcus sp.]
MRPLELSVRGFMPFRDQVDIDFAGLQLFAIQGATGSGKSSLLDAITFALYGETDRLGQTGLDALISTGERAFAVSLTFESGGEVYRAARTKGRKQAENQLRLEQRDGADAKRWSNLSENTNRATQARVSKLLGLDFKSFTRAVMLPQGKFDALLRGSKAERQKLLGELTNLGHVAEMHARAADQVKAHKFELAGAHHLLEGEYAGVSAEALVALKAERDAAVTALQTFGDDAEGLQAELSRLRAQEAVQRELDEAGRHLTALDAQAEGVRAGAERAERARIVATALPLLDAATQATQAAERAVNAAGAAGAGLESAAAALARTATLERAALDAQASGNVQLGARLERAGQVERAWPLLRGAEQSGQTHERAQQASATAGAALDRAQQDVETAAARESSARTATGRIPELEARNEMLREADADLRRLKLAGGTPQTTHPKPLPWDEEAHQRAREAATQIAQNRKERAVLDSEKAGLKADQARHLENTQLQRVQKAEMEQITLDGRQLKAEFDAAKARLDEARLIAGLSAHRTHLHLGQPCPLCEQSVKTLPSGSKADLGELEAALGAAELQLELQRDRYKNLKAQTDVRVRQLEDKARELTDWEAALGDREADLRVAEARFTGDEPDTALRLLSGLAARVNLAGRDPAGERKKAQAEIAALNTALDDARKAQAQASAAHAAAAATLAAAAQGLNERQAEAERAAIALNDVLADLDLSADEVQSAPDPAAERRAVQTELKALADALEAARRAHAEAGAVHAAAAATAGAARERASERQAEAVRAETALNAVLAALKLSAEDVQSAALPEDQIRALDAALRGHLAAREQMKAEVAALEAKLGGVPFDPARLAQAGRDLYAAQAALSTAQARLGELAESIRAGTERLARKTELEAKAGTLAGTVDLWTTLANSLRANEFQQYLLQEIEARLLTGAGELLHDISDGRYRLALEGGDYVVQDLWNAGETRGVKTLSGGETFLASLSLAIALSDYLAGNRILGALFLDEGFGTLDPQALDSVAGALENLRTQGRMVGVITHVESLSERLPSRLLVSKSVAGSSVQRLDG